MKPKPPPTIPPEALERLEAERIRAGVSRDPGPGGWARKVLKISGVDVPVHYIRTQPEFLEKARQTLQRSTPVPAIEIWKIWATEDDAIEESRLEKLATHHGFSAEAVKKYACDLLYELGSLARDGNEICVSQVTWGIMTTPAVSADSRKQLESLYWCVQFKKLNPECVREDREFVAKHFPHTPDGAPMYLLLQNFIWFRLADTLKFQSFFEKWRIPPGLVSDPNISLDILLGQQFLNFRIAPPLWMITSSVVRGLKKGKHRDGPRAFLSIDIRRPAKLIREELGQFMSECTFASPRQGYKAPLGAPAKALPSSRSGPFYLPVLIDLRFQRRLIESAVMRLVTVRAKSTPTSKNFLRTSTREHEGLPQLLLEAYKQYRKGRSLEEIGRLSPQPGTPAALKARGQNLVRSAFERIFDRCFNEMAPELCPTENELTVVGFTGVDDPSIYSLANRPCKFIPKEERPKWQLASRYVKHNVGRMRTKRGISKEARRLALIKKDWWRKINLDGTSEAPPKDKASNSNSGQKTPKPDMNGK